MTGTAKRAGRSTEGRDRSQQNGSSVLARIRARMPTLPASDARVARAILTDPLGTIHLTVSELADRAQTAESTAIRCCVKLGFHGFQDLKLNLARENPVDPPEQIAAVDAEDPAPVALMKVMGFLSNVVADAASGIDPSQFEETTRALSTAREILLIGYGESFKVAADAQDRLLAIGLSARAPSDSNLKVLRSQDLAHGDCCLLVSNSGATKEVVRCAEIAKGRGATTIALTSSPRSRLANACVYTLAAGGRDLGFGLEEISGRFVHLAVIDALYVAIMLRLRETGAEHLRRYQDLETSWQY